MTEWLSAHAHYGTGGERLLRSAVVPMLGRLAMDDVHVQFFFIHYWLGGPHLRLRLAVADAAQREHVRQAIEIGLAHWMTANPALDVGDPAPTVDLVTMFRREYPDADAAEWFDGNGGMRRLPTNALVWTPYERELARYGGTSCISHAEWHFCRSTEVVLALLDTADVVSRRRRLGFAAQLLVLLLASCDCASGPDGPTRRVAGSGAGWAADWANGYAESWRWFVDDDAIFERLVRSGRLLAAVRRSDKLSLPQLFHIGGSGGLLPATYEAWRAACRTTIGALHAEHRAGSPVTRSRWSPTQDADDPTRGIVASLLHMTFNRLGISIMDEIRVAAHVSIQLAERAIA